MAHILRLPRSDEAESFILVHVSSSGRQQLDLKLVGTEGSAPYVSTVKHAQVNALRSKTSQCTEAEWAEILEFVLLGGEDYQSEVTNVEAVATVEENEAITITVRRKIEGITQRLGTLSLAHDESQEIELFDWCDIAIQKTGTSNHQLTSLNSKLKELADANRKLEAQLDELIVAKKNHETQLLQKFCLLLNEKKAKIRDQQRLLARVTADPKESEEIQATPKSNKRAAKSSRDGKRKAAAKDEDVTEDSDEGFEKMDVDVNRVPQDSEQEDAATPDEEQNDEETADEDESSPTEKPPSHIGRRDPLDGPKPNAHTRSHDKGSPSDATGKTSQIELEKEKTPPRRDLPFLKKSAPAPAKPAHADDGDETASDDDEL